MINDDIEINIKKIVLFGNANNTDYKDVIEDFKSQLTNLIEINGIDKSSNYNLSYEGNNFKSNKVNKEISKFSGDDLAKIVFDRIINSNSMDNGK
jgi:effector-binding domain-containing protein